MGHLAGARRKTSPADDPMAAAVFVVGLVADGSGAFDVVVDNRHGINAEEAAELMRMAANRLDGSDDRAAGSWGHR